MSTTWSRRALLGTVAVALSGCSTDSDTTPTTITDRVTDTGSPSPTVVETATEAGQTGTEPDEFERLPADDPALAWAVRLPGPVSAPAALNPASDRLYVGTGKRHGNGETEVRESEDGVSSNAQTPDESSRGAVYSLRATDGKKEWRTVATGPIAEQPLVHDGRVDVIEGVTGMLRPGIGDPKIVRYGTDGTRLWTADPAGPKLSLLGADGGRAFAGSKDDELVGDANESLFALDSEGTVAWQREASDAMGGTIAGERLLHWDATEELTAYDLETGAKAWEVSEKPIPTSTVDLGLRSAFDPVAFDGVCFTKSREESDGSQALVARSAVDGSELWRYTASDGGTYAPDRVANTSDVVDGQRERPSIVGTGTDGSVFSLSPDGTERWTTAVGGPERGGPLVGDSVYLHDTHDTIYALDPVDGTERWRASVPGIGAMRLLSNGVIVFSPGENGDVVASFRSDGSERWRYESSKDFALPAVHGNRIYAGTADGTVLAFAGE